MTFPINFALLAKQSALILLSLTGLVAVDKHENTEKDGRNSIIFQQSEKAWPFHKIKGFAQIHCTSIYWNALSVVMLNDVCCSHEHMVVLVPA